MRINEVDTSRSALPDAETLLGLVTFLNGRAVDTGAKKQISQDAFINLAQSLGVSITKQSLPELTSRPPLSDLLEPVSADPNAPIVYKGGKPEQEPTMPVDKAQDVVAKAAKSAMKRDRNP